MRQSIIACLGTLLLVLLLQVKKGPSIKYKVLILPLLLLLPISFIFLKSLYVGTPGSVETLSSDPTLVRVWISVISGISFKIVTASFHIPLLFFLMLAFIPWRKEDISSSILNTFTFFFLYFIFFSASIQYWGSGRYLSEFIVPFIILGIVKFAFLTSQKRYLGLAGLLALGLLYVYHVYSFIHLNSYSKEIAISYPAPKKVRTVISEDINNYHEVLTYLKKENASSKVLFADEWLYYNLPFIIHDFSVKDCMTQKAYLKDFVKEKEFELSDLKYVENKINYIVIDPLYKGNGKSVEQLKRLGWLKVPKEFKNSRYILLYKNNL